MCPLCRLLCSLVPFSAVCQAGVSYCLRWLVSSSSLACAACIGFVLLVCLFHRSFVPLHLCLVLILCILSLIGAVPVGRIVLGHLLLQFVRCVLPFTLCFSFMFDALWLLISVHIVVLSVFQLAEHVLDFPSIQI